MHKADFLIAHPLKHHVFPLASGIISGDFTAILAVPFYRKGLAHILNYFPGKVGRKARGYYYDSLDVGNVEIYSPTTWQFRRLRVNSDGELAVFTDLFDKFIAEKIIKHEFKFQTLVTMQDYMPKTVAAAKAAGARIWSDQILNQSDAAIARIRSHAINENIPWDGRHDERNNSEILAISDVVTGACDYTFEGLNQRLSPKTRSFKIPYGVDRNVFRPKQKQYHNEIIVAARANSVRKGGHLLVRAIEENFQKLDRLSGGRPIEIRIIGRLAPEVKKMLLSASFVNKISVREYVIPYSDMAEFLNEADIFLMPSLSEGMSLLCIEAMSVGLPIIVTPYCGIDVFKNFEMGVGTLDTVESLGSAMATAFEQRESWHLWGRIASDATAGLTWKNYERKIAEAAGNL